MIGFFNWVRRRTHGASIYESNEEEPFDQETEDMIEASLALLRRMQSRSINLSNQRTVTHLLLGSDGDLSRAARLLSEQGYSVEEQGDGRLLISEQSAVNEDWVRQVVPTMCQTAGEFDLTYDGWDADVSADYSGQDN